MNFLLITQYYPPESGSASMRMSELGEYLATQGHAVTVVTGFPNYPQGKIYEGFKIRIFQKEVVNGVTVIRVPLYPTPFRKSFKHRMINYVSFMLTAVYGGLMAKKPDLTYYYSPPIFIGITTWVLKIFYRVPTVVEINDLWPQAPIALGVIKNKFLISMAEFLEKFVYRKTDYLFFYSHTHRKTIVGKGIPETKTDIHQLWVDTKHFEPKDGYKVESIKERYGFKNKFVVMYAGIIGMAQGMNVIIKVAQQVMATNPDILFAIVGDGGEKKALVQEALERGLGNILFIPFQPVSDIPFFLSAADVLFAHLVSAPHRLGTIPAKVLAYMSMGKPLVVAVEGETADLLERSQAGIAVKPGYPDGIAEAVLNLYQNKEMRMEMGARGRKYAEQHFDREVLLGSLERHLIKIARAREKK